MKKWLTECFDFLLPHTCVMCGERLHEGESCLCTACNRSLPRTDFHVQRDNPLERQFYGRVPLEKAAAFFHYIKGNDACQILYDIKYYGHPCTGRAMGRMLASEWAASSFFDDVDCLIPVPLARGRLHKRGYNQCEWLAKGISDITGIPAEKSVLTRTVNNVTQTHKSANDRQGNVEGIFQLSPSAKRLRGKHVMLIDDVVTTGATLTACAHPLAMLEDVRISVLTLACAAEL